VTFLDLANAYGSVPHELLWAAFDFFFFRVPMSITNLVKACFGDLQFSFSTPEFSTTLQYLVKGKVVKGKVVDKTFFINGKTNSF